MISAKIRNMCLNLMTLFDCFIHPSSWTMLYLNPLNLFGCFIPPSWTAEKCCACLFSVKHQLELQTGNSFLETVDMKMSRFPLTFLFCVSTLHFSKGMLNLGLYFSSLGCRIISNIKSWISSYIPFPELLKHALNLFSQISLRQASPV